MTNELDNSSTIAEGVEVAHLLEDCGNASDMTYWCSGSWTTTNKIEDAFKDKFNYKSVKKHVKKDWDYGDAWVDLLRSEIDMERPVFYRGDKSDLSTSKHFFVIDGYDASDPDFFWINFGWGYPGNSYNMSRQYLNDITPGDHEYNKNQMAIVSISPTYTKDINIYDVSYSIVTDVKSEDAQQNIVLPASGKELKVKSSGELILTAGNSIKLKPGFHAKPGSKFTSQINPDYTKKMDIYVPTWVNFFSPNGDGVNDKLCIDVENANSWEFQAFNINGIPIFQSAGTITGNRACLWDGSGAYYQGGYACIIRFKNNYGRAVVNAYMVLVLGSRSTDSQEDSLVFKSTEREKQAYPIKSQSTNIQVTVYPNPNKGNFTLEVKQKNSASYSLEIINSIGVVIYTLDYLNSSKIEINQTGFPKGIYYIKVNSGGNYAFEKIIIQ